MGVTLRCACRPQAELQPARLADGLHALQCAACGGVLLSLPEYRVWQERLPTAPVLPAKALDADETDSGARSCPACTRLMQRHRVGATPDFRIDRCVPCQQVWFDRDEWAALVAAGLATRLPEVLSETWQRQLRNNELRQRREQTLRERHGDDCIDELLRMRRFLDLHPQRDELLALLRAGW